MAVIKAWTQFVAADLNSNPKGLPPGLGVDARNLDIMHGDLRGRAAPTTVFTITGTGTQQQTIYRMGRDAPSDTAYWLSWPTDVDVVRSLLAADTTERTYYTGDGLPKFTDNTHLSGSPLPNGFTTLGVPAPASAMTATLNTAGTGPTETRVYLDTFVRGNGDESAPNAATATITCPGGSTVDLSAFDAVPSGSHGITNRRIYVSTGADFQRVVDQLATLTTATDSGTRGLVLETGGSSVRPAWLTPPDNLAGLIGLWNGMMGGFTGKSYQLCVAYTPHAWPIEYEGIVADTIVGSAAFDNTWVLCTTGFPVMVSGSTPGGMNDQRVALKQGCVSKRSVTSVDHGVCWASAEGLCYIGRLGGARILTEAFVSKTAWAGIVPSSIIGACWKRWYIGFYDTGTVRGGFMIDTVEPNGITWLDHTAKGVWVDPISNSLYMVDTGNAIKKWDSGSPMNLTFKTDVARFADDTNAGCAIVIGTTYPITFKLYGDGTLQFTKTVNDDNAFWLPSGYRASEWQVELSAGTGPIEAVVLAHDMSDLP